MNRFNNKIKINLTYVLIKYSVLITFAVLVLIPVVLAIVSGFKSRGQLTSDPISFPKPFLWENYVDVVASSQFIRYFFNSTFIAVLTVVFTVICSASAGFVLSKFRFRGKEVIYNFLLIGLLFPLAIAILPIYLQLRSFNLVDSYLGVIIPQVAFGLPFNIMIFRGFFGEIPDELEDASMIDGCGKLGFFTKIVLPLSRPAIATVSILVWVGSWNSYFLPLIVLNDKDKFTLPMGSMDFIGQYGASWNLILAFFSVTMIPAIVFYLLAQKHLISGLTSGAIKG